MKKYREDQQGFQLGIYDAFRSSGSKRTIRQLTGMRGLMAKPKKSTAGGGEIMKTQFFELLKKVFLF